MVHQLWLVWIVEFFVIRHFSLIGDELRRGLEDFCFDPLLILLQGFIATILNAHVIMNKEIVIIIIWISLQSPRL
jgi:hypothetical protein